eukprot:353602-Prymnesium_polylepis.2
MAHPSAQERQAAARVHVRASDRHTWRESASFLVRVVRALGHAIAALQGRYPQRGSRHPSRPTSEDCPSRLVAGKAGSKWRALEWFATAHEHCNVAALQRAQELQLGLVRRLPVLV